MATQSITSTSETKEWILACNAFEQCEIESLKGDYLEILIQDNLTSLVSFEMKVQGHIEGE